MPRSISPANSEDRHTGHHQSCGTHQASERWSETRRGTSRGSIQDSRQVRIVLETELHGGIVLAGLGRVVASRLEVDV